MLYYLLTQLATSHSRASTGTVIVTLLLLTNVLAFCVAVSRCYGVMHCTCTSRTYKDPALADLLNELLHFGNSLCLYGRQMSLMVCIQLPQSLLMLTRHLMQLPPQFISFTISSLIPASTTHFLL